MIPALEYLTIAHAEVAGGSVGWRRLARVLHTARGMHAACYGEYRDADGYRCRRDPARAVHATYRALRRCGIPALQALSVARRFVAGDPATVVTWRYSVIAGKLRE